MKKFNYMKLPFFEDQNEVIISIFIGVLPKMPMVKEIVYDFVLITALD